jgi:two-component system, NtrC family, sensor histidine kinase GlrK
MKFYYPKSFTKMILAGFALAVLPLIFALINNAYSVHRLAQHGQRAVYQAVQATQNSRALIEQVTQMERLVRQYSIVGDPSLMRNYQAAHRQFNDTTQRMSQLQMADSQRGALTRVVESEAALHGKLEKSPLRPDQVAPMVAQFTLLGDRARELDTLGNQLVDREVETMDRMSSEVLQFSLWQVLALVPVALLLVVAAIFFISKPIQQIETAIQRMGDGHFAEKIKVTGPEDLRSVGRQLDWLRIRLLELEEQKTRFLRHVSHELKTPLTSMREGVELLSDEVTGTMTAGQVEIARILRQNTLRLQKLIEDLLSYHTAQFQTSSLVFNHFSVKDMAARVARQHGLAIRAKNITLETIISDFRMTADEKKIEAVLDNLISNAVKFSPFNGTIRVLVRLRGGEAIFDVADQGPGIPVAEREKVFEPFYQGRTEYSGTVKGTGLGLAIVREYVEAHGGSAEVMDDSNAGAHLRVSLPVEQTAKVAA